MLTRPQLDLDLRKGGGAGKNCKACKKHASEMSLANDSEQQTAFRGHEEPLQGAWVNPSFMRPAGVGFCV